ncbi:MAG: NHLP leader peptide family RiPP precursor [Rubrobacteraceae bacterium]
MSEAAGDPQEMRQRLMRRSMEDEELRQRLLSEPKATIEQELGTSLPEEVEIRAVEETQDTVYLVLPPKPQSTPKNSELSEMELETMAGGWTGNDGTQPGQTCVNDPNC